MMVRRPAPGLEATVTYSVMAICATVVLTAMVISGETETAFTTLFVVAFLWWALSGSP